MRAIKDVGCGFPPSLPERRRRTGKCPADYLSWWQKVIRSPLVQSMLPGNAYAVLIAHLYLHWTNDDHLQATNSLNFRAYPAARRRPESPAF